jgi:hypothetical protein
MTQEYDNNLRGVLFKNDRKEKDTHPDYKGSCEVDGEEYWISAWIKEGRNGKFMSLSFTEKEDQKPAPAPPPRGDSQGNRSRGTDRAQPRRDDIDDGIPFASSCDSFDMEPAGARKMSRYHY